mmetsp:Transcript_1475/g.4469  ORF Transcript_1475/g.4469 Transcript_1475/m.4469 type:complete len:162 (-) Transcript_1475:216-701(-)
MAAFVSALRGGGRLELQRRGAVCSVRNRVVMRVEEPENVTLRPSYNLPLGILGTASVLKLVGLSLGVVVPVGLIGAFLTFQAGNVRFRFTQRRLEVLKKNRGGEDKFIRAWDYTDWQNWELWWPSFPILCYFKEVSSIHFFSAHLSKRRASQLSPEEDGHS